MKISVVTPSFRNSQWLKLCIASVADQQGVEVEHIIQDAGSDDGTLDWLLHDSRVSAFREPDQGMYDGINRGLRKATGEILAHLNCDEQYLPGALAEVHRFFEEHPDIDIVFGDAVVTNADGECLCYRKFLVPHKYHTWLWDLAALTCGTFFRKRVLTEFNGYFDPRFRLCGDAERMLRLIEQKVPMGLLRRYTSAFTVTGENLSTGPNPEKETLRAMLPPPSWASPLTPLVVLHHRLRRLFGGIYIQPPFHYDIYTRESGTQRKRFHVAKPRARWRGWGTIDWLPK